MWKEFYEYWLEIAEKGTIPVYFFRFEDLVTDPQRILTEVFQFVSDSDSLEGTYLEKRINESVGKDSKIYSPREGGINMNLNKYSKDQFDLIASKCRHLIHYFGYS